jgi:hypothetical protein
MPVLAAVHLDRPDSGRWCRRLLAVADGHERGYRPLQGDRVIAKDGGNLLRGWALRGVAACHRGEQLTQSRLEVVWNLRVAV